MPIEIFSTNDNMLTVEKSGSSANSVFYMETDRSLNEEILNNLKAENLLDTLSSYQTYEFAMQDNTARGECDICGLSTDFKNRHICPDCWEKYEKEIVSGLKSIIRNKVVNLA